MVLSHSVTDYGLLHNTIIYVLRCLIVCTLPSKGTPLLEKVEKLTQTVVCRDSNTHMETFRDLSDIFYHEFSFHMKHLGYFSPTMNSYMVSFKYDYEEFPSKHWLYTGTFADISVEIPIISNLPPKLHFFMSKLLGVVKWIIRESKNRENMFPQTKTLVKDLITFKDVCLYISTMYDNNSLNVHGCVKSFLFVTLSQHQLSW